MVVVVVVVHSAVYFLIHPLLEREECDNRGDSTILLVAVTVYQKPHEPDERPSRAQLISVGMSVSGRQESIHHCINSRRLLES